MAKRNIWKKYIEKTKARIKQANAKRDQYIDLVIKHERLVSKYRGHASKLSLEIHHDSNLIHEYEERLEDEERN